MQLSFHLPNQNAITLRDSERFPALLQREGINVTMFNDWFELEKRDTTARTLTYADIPKHYIKGFEELMTVNKRLCATFKETCFAYGLLNDDKEWSYPIAEASLQIAIRLQGFTLTWPKLADKHGQSPDKRGIGF
ncbi:hypothetical protein Tco_0786596 [Tanacetum coccineum]